MQHTQIHRAPNVENVLSIVTKQTHICKMIQPILAYGSPVLRRECAAVQPGYYGLHSLIADMWETMDNADGVGIAAPQLGDSVQIFVVDSAKVFSDMDAAERNCHADSPGIRQVFINARITIRSAELVEDMEGCLSIPHILQPVQRSNRITVCFVDENFVEHTTEFCGMTARMIQHEYDHTEGKLFIDYLSSFRQRRLKAKLDRIASGHIQAPYPMNFW